MIFACIIGNKTRRQAVRASGLICAIIMLLTSCQTGGYGGNHETTADAVTSVTEEIGKSLDISLYTVVYGSEAGEAIRTLAQNLRDALEDKTGKKIKIKEDWVMPNESTDNDDYEILVGATNRSESKKHAGSLRYNDFIISTEGNKIIIFAHNEVLLGEAVAYFRLKLKEENGVYYWSGRYIKNGTYPLEGLCMLNVTADKYQIVIPDPPSAIESFVAGKIRELIAEKSGYLIEILKKAETAGKNRITIGIKSGINPDDYFAVASDGVIEMSAGSPVGLVALLLWFEELLENSESAVFDKNRLECSGRVSEGPAKRYEGTELRIMTSNVLFTDSPSFETPYRMSCLMQTYLLYLPDIIGLQEARNTQLSALVPYLEAVYATVPFSADDGGQVYQQILYLKGQYDLVDYGLTRFRYRVIPWGVSWAVFRRKSDGRLFAVTNTHNTVVASTYDPGLSNSVEGVQYRISNCNTVLETIDKIRDKYPGIPVFSTGDWNSTVSEESLGPMNASELMKNAMQEAIVADTKTNSGHQLGSLPGSSGNIIDHIFFSADVASALYHDVVVNHTVINGSDHCPVIADFKILS